MMFHIITIFPEIFNSYFQESIIKRAQVNKAINIKIYNLRDWTEDKHKTVDDTPYGGGAGMIMKVDILYKAIKSIKSKINTNNLQPTTYNLQTILTSAKGKTWNQQKAQKYSKLDNIILVCGRYEGVDERITNFVDEEISIGDYILTGGEIPAMVIVDSVTRLLPGVLGNEKSLEEESFSFNNNNRHSTFDIRQLEYPQYTRPEVFEANNKKYKVPKVLLSGNHKEIEEWRKKNSKKV